MAVQPISMTAAPVAVVDEVAASVTAEAATAVKTPVKTKRSRRKN